MDVIEDTTMAIQFYSSQGDTRDKGRLYLETYGVLQALVVRQDAVLDLCKALGFSSTRGDDSSFVRVRTARVAVAGHPTKKQRDQRQGPHFLVQMSLGRNSFEVMSTSSDGRAKFTSVDVSGLIQEQEEVLYQILKEVITDLKEADRKHRVKFRTEKLEALFPPTLSYCFEKIYEHIRQGVGIGMYGVDEVRSVLDAFRETLEARGISIDTYDSVKHVYERIAYPIGQVEAYLQGLDSEIKTQAAAEIFTYFIRQQMDQLQVIAKDIDRDFAS